MNRYSPRRGGIVVGQTYRRSGSRAQTIAIFVLLAALIAVLIVGLPSIRYRADARRLFAGRMLTECDLAVRQVTTLSRTSSSNSYATLASIRSELYAMSVLNQTEQGLSGSPLIEESYFTNLFYIIDQYYATLITNGTQTGNLQTELTQQINDLRNVVAAIE